MTKPDRFHDRIITLLPKLKLQAMALSRNRSVADDLVQEAAVKALMARGSFAEGTNFGAWMYRILRNTFLSWLRDRRETQDLADAPVAVLGVPGSAFDRLVLRELAAALARLTPEQREALIMVCVRGLSYEHAAAITGVAVGTTKCRVFRARRALREILAEEAQGAAPERARIDWPHRIAQLRAAPLPAPRRPAIEVDEPVAPIQADAAGLQIGGDARDFHGDPPGQAHIRRHARHVQRHTADAA